MVVEGINLEGEMCARPSACRSAIRRSRGCGCARSGSALRRRATRSTISNVAFGSYAKRIGLEVGYDVVAVLRKADQPSSLIPIGLALAATAGVAGLQFARARKQADSKASGPGALSLQPFTRQSARP